MLNSIPVSVFGKNAMSRIRQLGELELFILLAGLSLAFGFAVPSIVEWEHSGSIFQQKFVVLERSSISILLVTIVAACLIWWFKRSSSVPPSEPQKFQFTLKSFLIASAAIGVSFGLTIVLGPNRAHIAVISLELVILGFGLFYFRSFACRLGTILAIATFPFIWAVAFNRPFGHTSGLLAIIPIGTGLIPAQLVCNTVDSLGRDESLELAAIFVIYSIAHPGIFPHTKEGNQWTVNQWLEYDWRAGWGTDEFEDALDDGKFAYQFPQAWQEADDRYDAREIVDANIKKLEYKRDVRRQLLENGSKLDGPFFTTQPQVNKPLKFRYCVTNINPGHNMPSGSLGAQPQIWINTALIGPSGQRIWESGYLDSNGDLADNHSLDVLDRKIPFDTQLVNFQTKFLTTNVKGTDREMYLPVNFDFDQLPFLRPAPQPVTVINHPPFIRMESHSIPPLGKRNVKYSVPARLIQAPGNYRLSIRMRSRAEPIYFMRFCDSTKEMERSMNEWIADFHSSSVTFQVR